MLARLSPPSDKRVILSEITKKKKKIPLSKGLLSLNMQTLQGDKISMGFKGSSQYGYIR
jgi:hypothetical protein